MERPNIAPKKGGYALKQAGVGRIAKEDIPVMIQNVSQFTGIKAKDLHPLGSVGKTPTSGDIDLAVDTNKYDENTIHELMRSRLGDSNCVYNKGTKVASYAFPVTGDNAGLVQVDLMYVDNPDWASFSYHSPGTDSNYKGAIRTMLLMGVAATYHEPGIDYFEFDSESNDLIIRAGRTLDLNTGLRRIFQYRPKSKKDGRYLKTMKSISVDTFKDLFPDIEISGENVLIDDPNTVLTKLFGENVTPYDVNTGEQVIDLIKKTFTKERQQSIFKKAASRAQSVIGKMELPPEMMEYLNVK